MHGASDKAMPLLTKLADRSPAAAWALIRIGRPAEPAILTLLREPGDEYSGARGAYNIIRQWCDHWKEAQTPPSAAILTALHDKVESMLGRSSLIERYGVELLTLAGDPFVFKNPRQAMAAFLSMMSDDKQAQRRALLLPLHFRHNKPAPGFLDDAKAGTLVIQEVRADAHTGWAHLADRQGQTHYVVWIGQSGAGWELTLAKKVPADRVAADLAMFLKSHPEAKELPAGESGATPDTAARNDLAVSQLAERFMAAMRDKDLDTLKRWSMGSVQGWVSPEEAKESPGRIPAGWSVPRLEAAISVIGNISAKSISAARWNAASAPTRGLTFNSAYSSNVSPIRSIRLLLA